MTESFEPFGCFCRFAFCHLLEYAPLIQGRFSQGRALEQRERKLEEVARARFVYTGSSTGDSHVERSSEALICVQDMFQPSLFSLFLTASETRPMGPTPAFAIYVSRDVLVLLSRLACLSL